MAPYLGFGASLLVGIETVWGTAVARTYSFPLVSEGLKRTVEKAPRNTLAASLSGRASRKHFIGADNVGGTATLLMTYEGFGIWWKHLLGEAAAPTGTNPYTHVYTLAMNTLPGLTLEPVRGTGTSEVFDGMKVNKGTFKIEPGKEVTATFDFIGRTSGGRTAAATPSFATSRDTVVIFDESGDVSWNGASKITTGFEITVDNKLARRPRVGSRLTSEPMPTGMMDILVRVDLEWEDDDMHDALIADTEADFTVTFTDADARTITFELNNAYVEDVSDPVTSVGVIKQTVTLRAQADATSEGITVTVVNTQATSILA